MNKPGVYFLKNNSAIYTHISQDLLFDKFIHSCIMIMCFDQIYPHCLPSNAFPLPTMTFPSQIRVLFFFSRLLKHV